MEGSFVLDYFLLVFAASCGLYQMAGAYNLLRGLMLLESPILTFGLGLALFAGAFAWFFLSEPRNLPDSGPGLTGNEQFGYFFAGGGAGLAVTLTVTSLRNWKLGREADLSVLGLDSLRASNYLRAFCLSVAQIPRALRALRQPEIGTDGAPTVSGHGDGDG